jgi:hypothetical protein
MREQQVGIAEREAAGPAEAAEVEENETIPAREREHERKVVKRLHPEAVEEQARRADADVEVMEGVPSARAKEGHLP